MESKKCTKCGELKPLSEFYNDKRVKKDGKTARCKKCLDDQKREYRQTHKDQRNEYERNRRETDESWKVDLAERNKKYYNKLKEDEDRFKIYQNNRINWRKSLDPRYNMWMGARDRAYNKNIPFDIELEDIIIPDLCPILNIPLVKNEKCADRDSPTLDRIIPNLGYTKNNIKVISRLANTMKQDASFDELKLFSKNILLYIKNYEDIVRTAENKESVELENKEFLG